jgi:hypothetical protein
MSALKEFEDTAFDGRPGFWTHALQGACALCGVTMTTYAINGSTSPTELIERGKGHIDCPCLCCSEQQGGRIVLLYVTSWDHEPSPQEKVDAGLESIDSLGFLYQELAFADEDDEDLSEDDDDPSDSFRWRPADS